MRADELGYGGGGDGDSDEDEFPIVEMHAARAEEVGSDTEDGGEEEVIELLGAVIVDGVRITERDGPDDDGDEEEEEVEVAEAAGDEWRSGPWGDERLVGSGRATGAESSKLELPEWQARKELGVTAVDAKLWSGAAAAGWRIVPKQRGGETRARWLYISPEGEFLYRAPTGARRFKERKGERPKHLLPGFLKGRRRRRCRRPSARS